MEQLLHQLIEQVCQYPPQSPQRRKLMNQLLAKMQQLPGLLKANHPDYLDALNQTWLWVNKNICSQFDVSQLEVEKRLRQWLNSYLYWRLKDLHSPHPSLSLNKLIDGDEISLIDLLPETGFLLPTRSELDRYIEVLEEKQRVNLFHKFQEYLRQDPDEKLRKCHPKGYPECNCQAISLRQLKDPPDQLSVIARELGVNYQTLNSHWKRRCLPLLREVAIELGYQQED